MFSRIDGTLVRQAHPIRRMLPFLMPTRTEAYTHYRQRILTTEARKVLERVNRDRPADRPVTFFVLLLRAGSFVLEEFPRLNRFLAGGRFYQRNGIWLSFSAKKRMEIDAPIFTCKRRFVPREETLGQVTDAVYELLEPGRAGKQTTADLEAKWLLKLPIPALRLAMVGVRRLYHWNLLPARMIELDALYASAFVINLGSLGLDAAYHHNFEYGNVPITAVIGREQKLPWVGPEGQIEARDQVEICYTYDERTEDGFYCLVALRRLKELVEERPEELVEVMA